LNSAEKIKLFEKVLTAAQVTGTEQQLDDACVDVFGRWPGNAAAIV